MEMRGRNGKWLGARNVRAVGVSWVNMIRKFRSRVCSRWRGLNAFIVADVIEHCAEVSHHQHVRSENGGRDGRGSVNWEEGANCGELAADFFFLDVEKMSDVLNHLLVGKGQFITNRAVWRGRSDDVGGVAGTVGRGRGTRWDKDRGG